MPNNIIFYFTDQQRWDTCGCFGQPLDITPNLDQLAREGVRFDNAFSPQPVCGPCRALFQTGKWPTETGCFRNNIMLPAGVKTLANYIEEAGYETAYIGKWHLASDAELEKPAVAKLGDVWTLGRHRLVVGDSTLPETYDVLMAGAKANLVVTDPPYNVDYEGSAGKIKNDHMEDENFYQFLFAAFVNMEQHMESDASIYVFHADTEGLNFRSAFKAAGFYLSGCCIWKKQSLVLGRSPYQWQHEPCLFGWKKGGKHNWYSDRKQTTIWEFDRPKKSDSHPTQKPVGLIAYPIKNSSMSNCIVLDPFGGSGSTLIACEQTNRICYTIELDEKYADVIVNRYIEQAGSAENVFVERDGVKIPYAELTGEVKGNE